MFIVLTEIPLHDFVMRDRSYIMHSNFLLILSSIKRPKSPETGQKTLKKSFKLKGHLRTLNENLKGRCSKE